MSILEIANLEMDFLCQEMDLSDVMINFFYGKASCIERLKAINFMHVYIIF